MLGKPNHTTYETLELDHVGVKSPQFSYNRLKGADPVAGVEMASTGEVACLGDDLEEAFYNSWHATEQRVASKSVFLSIQDDQKHKFAEEVALLAGAGWKIFTTLGTHQYLKQLGIKSTRLYKIHEKLEPSIESAIKHKKFELMISIPSPVESSANAYKIRRLAIDNHLPLLTNAETARLLLRCLTDKTLGSREPKALADYLKKYITALS